MTTYVYDALDYNKAQTRLVTIPTLGNLDESAPLHISLHTVTIPTRCLVTPLESATQEADLKSDDSDTEKPEFVALSYVWGSPDDPSEVFVESAPEGANKISITRNLDVALRHMRSKIEGPVTFWIDAICIDQGNIQERSYQVNFMDSIYTIAQGTSIWLGLEENDSDRAMDFLSYLGERVSAKGDGTFRRAPYAPPREPEEPIWESLDEPATLGEDDMQAVVSLLERPWFTRLWIRQEIALAEEAQIQCGTRVLDWDYFKVAASCLLRKRSIAWLSNDLCRRVAKIKRHIITLCEGLLSYDYEFMRFQNKGVCSTDPRDMIYGIRSLLTPQDKSLGVQPNYTLEAADVFMDVCVRIVQRQSRTYFLRRCELSSISTPNLPSWVPDWSTSMTAQAYLFNFWSACGCISANATYLGDKILRVSGIRIDQITSIRDLYDHTNDGVLLDRSVLIRQIRNCRPEKDRIHSPYDENQSLMDAYCRTFARDNFLETYYPAGSTRTSLAEAGPRLSFDEAKEALEKIWAMDEDSSSLDDLVDDYSIYRFTRNCASCYERRFFITQDGYIGLAPQDVELGDIVAVILGCDVPLILRKHPSSTAEPDETRWKVVGACYTNGLMSGEAIYGRLPSHYRAVFCEQAANDECICGEGYAFLDTRTGELKNDPAAVLEEFGIKPSSWSRQPHRLEVSESVLRGAGVKLQDFLLV